jgi:guanylate kinase
MFKGKCFIFSAPSGSGKTTIVKHLLGNNSNLGFSISASTRDRRGRAEENGQDYYFLTPEEFKIKIDEGAFVEWEQVYPGQLYGTLKAEIERVWATGKHVVFDVDVKGGLNLKKYFGSDALAIFVKCPSKELLEQRLRNRATDSEESISARLFKVNFEMSFEKEFDVTLVNEDLETAYTDAQKLIDVFLTQ